MTKRKTLQATAILALLLAGTTLIPAVSATTQMKTQAIKCYSEEDGALTELLAAGCRFAVASIICIGNYDPYNDPPASFVDCEV